MFVVPRAPPRPLVPLDRRLLADASVAVLRVQSHRCMRPFYLQFNDRTIIGQAFTELLGALLRFVLLGCFVFVLPSFALQIVTESLLALARLSK